MSESFHIRLKLQNGAELEASGGLDYVRTEREAFVAMNMGPKIEHEHVQGPHNQTQDASQIEHLHQIWDSIIETGKGSNIQLRAKLNGDKTQKDACLVLLAAAQKILRISKPTATQLARWLRASGYPVQRVDRAIAEGISNGDILASGSRRARRYESTGPGLAKGYILAQQLAQLIAGK